MADDKGEIVGDGEMKVVISVRENPNEETMDVSVRSYNLTQKDAIDLLVEALDVVRQGPLISSPDLSEVDAYAELLARGEAYNDVAQQTSPTSRRGQ
jgi:hypothetical protein